MRYICAQPANDFYTWQVETVINNFTKHGVNPNKIDILCAIDNDVVPENWRKLQNHYNTVRFFFYNDTRADKSYIPSIYFNLMSNHMKANPDLIGQRLFLHDCDIVFTRSPEVDWTMPGKIWYLSDTNSYINYDYIQQKGNHIYEEMCNIVGIDKLIPKLLNSHGGGAQYITIGESFEFWDKVESDSVKLYSYFCNTEHLHVEKYPNDYAIQKWTAGMWSLLWNIWLKGYETKVDSRLNFGWSTDHISSVDRNWILHNAGVSATDVSLFFKGNYINKLPYNETLNVDESRASSYYWKEVQEAGKNSILLQKVMSSLKNKVIYSENPLEHWSDITDLTNKCVLDLGCGWINSGFQSTPEYFLSRGASKIIGIDETQIEIEKLKEIYPNHTFICQSINTSNDLINLITTHTPDFIKMDIEGFETLIKDVPIKVFDSVKEIAVEYHSAECKKIVLDKLKQLDFEVFALNNFGFYCTDSDIMGVIHAKRKLKVLVYTSSYSKRPYMMRQIMLGVLNQTYKNITQVVNITMDEDSTTKDHLPLYEDLVRKDLIVIYTENAHSHINNMRAIKAVPNYLDYDLYIKMDDDDIHKSKYVENIVKYFEEHINVDIVSTYIDYQLNGFDLVKGPFDNLGANPGNTDYHMPMTFAYNKKAFLEISELTELTGYDDNMWRDAWYNAGLNHETVNNNSEVIWHIHGKNQSCPEFLKKPVEFNSTIS